jgi:exosortase A-associated hydrolase 2
MSETPLFFPTGRGQLFGVLHAPDATLPGRAFVFCHPLTEEKLWSHRVFVSFARQLAAAGHAVLRFDFRGIGDSEGRFRDSSVAGLREDVASAIREVTQRTGATRITLLGVRFGATIAALVAEDAPAVDQLVLWAPIVDGARYMQELLRMNLTTQMATFKEVRFDREALAGQMRDGQTVNVDGYELGHTLYADVSSIALAAEPKRFAGRCLIVQIERRNKPDAELQKLAATYPQATLTTAEEEPFWKEIARFYDRAPNLFAVTLEHLA